MLASQDAMDRRKNSFELYGADFMLMEDYSVWLIEINSHPDMSSSTSVTTRLCRKVLEDTIKVAVDYGTAVTPQEQSAVDTGHFELVYKQKLSPIQAHLAAGLSLHGTRIGMPIVQENQQGSRGRSPVVSRKTRRPAVGLGVNPARPPMLVDLLELKLNHEFFEYLRLRPVSASLPRQTLPLPVASEPSENQVSSRPETAVKVEQANIRELENKTPRVTKNKPKEVVHEQVKLFKPARAPKVEAIAAKTPAIEAPKTAKVGQLHHRSSTKTAGTQV